MSAGPRAAAALCAALLCASLSACALLAPKPPPSRFVVLATVHELTGEAPDPPSGGPTVGLGPLSLPDYLRRAALVTRDGTELLPSEGELWAEPLERAVERVLAVDLRDALGAARVVPYPWYESERPDSAVEIAFTRFERDASGVVVLAATWRVRGAEGGPALERETRIQRDAGPDAASTALALSEALVELCDEIARAADSGRSSAP